MSTQLQFPLGVAPVRPPERAVIAAQEVIITERTSDDFEQLHAELEALLRRLQDTIPHGPLFKEAWDKARAATCKSYDWTEKAFYAELRERLREKRGGST